MLRISIYLAAASRAGSARPGRLAPGVSCVLLSIRCGIKSSAIEKNEKVLLSSRAADVIQEQATPRKLDEAAWLVERQKNKWRSTTAPLKTSIRNFAHRFFMLHVLPRAFDEKIYFRN